MLEHEVVANAHVLWYAAGNPNLRADCHFHHHHTSSSIQGLENDLRRLGLIWSVGGYRYCPIIEKKVRLKEIYNLDCHHCSNIQTHWAAEWENSDKISSDISQLSNYIVIQKGDFLNPHIVRKSAPKVSFSKILIRGQKVFPDKKDRA